MESDNILTHLCCPPPNYQTHAAQWEKESDRRVLDCGLYVSSENSQKDIGLVTSMYFVVEHSKECRLWILNLSWCSLCLGEQSSSSLLGAEPGLSPKPAKSICHIFNRLAKFVAQIYTTGYNCEETQNCSSFHWFKIATFLNRDTLIFFFSAWKT